VGILYNVANVDKSESSMEKSPKAYHEFMYDNDSGAGILSLFDDVNQLIKTIKSDIEDLNADYNKLKQLYDEFTDFDQAMNSIINTMKYRIEYVENAFLNIVSTARQTVMDQMKEDSTLMSDLESINAMLGNGNNSLNNGSTSSNFRNSGNETTTSTNRSNNVRESIAAAYARANKMRQVKQNNDVTLNYETYDEWMGK